MTKNRLKAYKSNKAEIMEKTKKLRTLGEDNSMLVQDTIMDYRSGYPIPSVVMGIDWKRYDREKRRLCRRIETLEKENQEIEDFIDSVQDSITRRVLEKYYLEGKSQRQVGREIGIDQSLVSKKIKDFIKLEYNS